MGAAGAVGRLIVSASSARRIDGREHTGARFDRLARLQAQVFAEASRDQLHAHGGAVHRCGRSRVGGQQQMLAMGRAMMSKPKLLSAVA